MKLFRYIVIAGLLFVPASVLAQDEQPDLTAPDQLTPTQLQQEQQTEPQEQNSPVVPPSPGEFSQDTSREEIQRQADEQKAVALQERCAQVLEKVTTHKDKIGSFKQKHASVLSRIDTKLDNLLSRAELNESIDISGLTTAVDNLDAQVEALNVAVSSYESKVEEVIGNDCTDRENAKTTHDMLKSLRSDNAELKKLRAAVRSAITEDIKGELQAIKDSLASSAEGA